MIYRKAIGIVHRYEPQSGWGTSTRYVEIADDEYATRHVEVFENGNALRYDRTNWIDEADSLAAARYDPVRWQEAWGPDHPSDAEEFNAAWLSVTEAPNQPQAYLNHGPWPVLRQIVRQGG
jgi:hypothetical protein